ncbi:MULTISPECIES: hypothetical protein [unclassified Rhizobium]|uniref:hypothetical protein n=1 Tax=unclassified Rhizobium TaxID=2613769 RepID=UPI000EA84480|nr:MULTISPECIES: hypothetical protein [unclassified Rhizobium]AYG65719.1 hypothetical protein CCGE531_06700 [Rhizobium sp. CCGE531]AYG72200.1 hypothetical protein CCGE532_06700 [Rhizobium sp. CCGE532]
MKNSHKSVSAYSIDDDETETELEVIGRFMTRLKVKNLPRNYQLFHEALYGQDRCLAEEVEALGALPSQNGLDEIGLKHRLVSHCGLVARKSESDAAEMLREVADQLAKGLMKKQRFVREIDATPLGYAALDSLNASLSNLMLYETELTERLRNCANPSKSSQNATT